MGPLCKHWGHPRTSHSCQNSCCIHNNGRCRRPVCKLRLGRWRAAGGRCTSALVLLQPGLLPAVGARGGHRRVRGLARRRGSQEESTTIGFWEAPNSRIKQPEDDSDDFRDQSMNLTPWHTVGFIVMASGMLVLLYYFDITLLVTVMYCVSCAAAVAMVVLRPLLVRLLGPQAWAPLCPVPAA
ncbi:unnamed protein product, partial [Heterosigma akashiwo]